jgi:hypothetical protein
MIAALAVTLLHQPLLRGRAPVEKLETFDTLAECYLHWDTLPKSQQSFTWCSNTGKSGGIGGGSDGKVPEIVE